MACRFGVPSDAPKDVAMYSFTPGSLQIPSSFVTVCGQSPSRVSMLFANRSSESAQHDDDHDDDNNNTNTNKNNTATTTNNTDNDTNTDNTNTNTNNADNSS